MQYSPCRVLRMTLIAALLTFPCNLNSFSQQPKAKPIQTPRKIAFAEAQKLITSEKEGNLSSQPGKYSRTKLRDGQVLELYYPIIAPDPRRRGRSVTTPGYGMLYDSELAYKDANRARHVLEDLIPDGRQLISDIPQLVARLEKRLRLGPGKLDYSRASLKRVDTFLVGYLNSHSTMQTDPQLFQELTAYYGETLRRAADGQWRVREERVSDLHLQPEPNILLNTTGGRKEIKPWSGLLSVLYDEDKRGAGLTRLFDADVAAAR